MFLYVRNELDVFEGKLESYLTSMNQTGTLTPIILQVKELMNVTKGKAILAQVAVSLGWVATPQKGTITNATISDVLQGRKISMMCILHNFSLPCYSQD